VLALIVDDEPPARRGMRALLRAFGDVEVVGEAGSVSEAASCIRQLRPDLVFLDIQLRGSNAFELFGLIEGTPLPAIVVVTAHSDHAVRAFEKEAVDYLLKPIEPERLAQSIDRVRRSLREAVPRKIAVRLDGSTHFLEVGEIEAVEAAGNYCCVYGNPGQWMIRETLTSLLLRLKSPRFVRVHKSIAVAIDQISEMHPLPNRDAFVVLRSGRKLRVSRAFRDRLDSAMGVPRSGAPGS
jgi:two-component system LytT family response regulator